MTSRNSLLLQLQRHNCVSAVLTVVQIDFTKANQLSRYSLSIPSLYWCIKFHGYSSKQAENKNTDYNKFSAIIHSVVSR